MTISAAGHAGVRITVEWDNLFANCVSQCAVLFELWQDECARARELHPQSACNSKYHHTPHEATVTLSDNCVSFEWCIVAPHFRVVWTTGRHEVLTILLTKDWNVPCGDECTNHSNRLSKKHTPYYEMCLPTKASRGNLPPSFRRNPPEALLQRYSVCSLSFSDWFASIFPKQILRPQWISEKLSSSTKTPSSIFIFIIGGWQRRRRRPTNWAARVLLFYLLTTVSLKFNCCWGCLRW